MINTHSSDRSVGCNVVRQYKRVRYTFGRCAWDQRPGPRTEREAALRPILSSKWLAKNPSWSPLRASIGLWAILIDKLTSDVIVFHSFVNINIG